jgi:ParB family chromosome partitioning protein
MSSIVSESAPKRKALGRGLSALIPETSHVLSQRKPELFLEQEGFRILPLEKIKPNPAQPRRHFNEEAIDELAESIRQCGVLQPIIVFRVTDGYRIIAGERRYRAALRAHLTEIPAIIKDYSEEKILQVALIENLQRRDLNPIEEAQAYQELQQKHGLTHETIAQAVGKSRVYVSNMLRLLRLPPNIVEWVQAGTLSPGHARTLLAISDAASATQLAENWIKSPCSVRKAEQEVASWQAAQAKTSNTPTRDAESLASSPSPVADLEIHLTHQLGTKVQIRQKTTTSGLLEIHYTSLDILDGILERLSSI